MKKPSVHNNWDPLEEIWLGDVWPSHFYDDFEDPIIRDAFYQITEWTKEDLNIIQKKLEELGVRVRRPYVDGPKESYQVYISNQKGFRLARPPITPRDSNAVVGDKLFFGDHDLRNCYKDLLAEYDPSHIYKSSMASIPNISGANIVKLGRDIVFDYAVDNIGIKEAAEKGGRKEIAFQTFDKFLKLENRMFGNDYRLHFATQGGHCDACFMPLQEGLLLASKYYKDYEIMFPGWETITLTDPTYHGYQGNYDKNFVPHKWNLPGVREPSHVNDFIEKYCPDWIGNFTETFFEVNIVMIDEKNMLCMGTHDTLFEKLARHGINCHVVPFRTRTFWDGGIHCITLDTIRRGEIKDYYPERGGYGVKSAVSSTFYFSTENFLKEYCASRNIPRPN
jgi:hypothetical protein